MQNELRSHLRACADAYAGATDLELTTIAQRAAGDWRFFDRLEDDGKSFFVSTYDKVMIWFSTRWPPKTPWPKGVPRPRVAEAAR